MANICHLFSVPPLPGKGSRSKPSLINSWSVGAEAVGSSKPAGFLSAMGACMRLLALSAEIELLVLPHIARWLPRHGRFHRLVDLHHLAIVDIPVLGVGDLHRQQA